jgi:hypothetical protein
VPTEKRANRIANINAIDATGEHTSEATGEGESTRLKAVAVVRVVSHLTIKFPLMNIPAARPPD